MNDIGRNQPCSCGSGKKYKKCHGASGAAVPAPLGPCNVVESCTLPGKDTGTCKACGKVYIGCLDHRSAISTLLSGHALRVHPELVGKAIREIRKNPALMANYEMLAEQEPHLWGKLWQHLQATPIDSARTLEAHVSRTLTALCMAVRQLAATPPPAGQEAHFSQDVKLLGWALTVGAQILSEGRPPPDPKLLRQAPLDIRRQVEAIEKLPAGMYWHVTAQLWPLRRGSTDWDWANLGKLIAVISGHLRSADETALAPEATGGLPDDPNAPIRWLWPVAR